MQHVQIQLIFNFSFFLGYKLLPMMGGKPGYEHDAIFRK